MIFCESDAPRKRRFSGFAALRLDESGVGERIMIFRIIVIGSAVPRVFWPRFFGWSRRDDDGCAERERCLCLWTPEMLVFRRFHPETVCVFMEERSKIGLG